jgi:predicted kinase
MLTITACIGLPGSGKTRYAIQEIVKNPYGLVRVSKDDLCQMCNNGVYSKVNEHLILEIRDTIITEALMAGNHVIVDDTNLNPIHILRFKEIAKTLAHKNVQVVVKDFRDVPIDVCIARDAAKEKPVGEIVIRKMAQDFMKHYTPENEITIDNNKRNPFIILVDIDGTVACK